ncbi:MAG: hypothetical protein SOY48_07745 [Eubacterium sp.]|nr:hypothetical protein [Eubacterium sp.]MDD6567631.1 hypothetical protein [Eubacteriales bacterium]MDY4110757.1 hypothetical protein [Eubacterium sp.]
MMNINDTLTSFAKALKADSFFKNIKIIKPYPYEFYAGEIKQSFVCVGLDEVDVSALELGDDTKYGNVKIKLDIFTPVSNSSYAKDIFLNACRVSQSFNIVSIKAEPLVYSKKSKGFRLDAYFTISDRIDFGGESGE